jgi:programmed cell death protein 5
VNQLLTDCDLQIRKARLEQLKAQGGGAKSASGGSGGGGQEQAQQRQ